jgi:hypothetical protein
MRTVTFKISESDNRLLERLAAHSVSTKSEIIRNGITLLSEKQKQENFRKELNELQASNDRVMKALAYVLKNSIEAKMFASTSAQVVSKDDYASLSSRVQQRVSEEFEKIKKEIERY